MHSDRSPCQVVQQQLDAYNAHDIEAWLDTYAVDAVQMEFPTTLLASGQAEIRARASARFADLTTHAKLLKRTALANVVIDHEEITSTFSGLRGRVEIICIYAVHDGKIRSASFVWGDVVPTSA